MPRPFTGSKMFWDGPNFLCQTKNGFTYCAGPRLFVPDQKMIFCPHKNFWISTKCNSIFGRAQKQFGTCRRTRY